VEGDAAPNEEGESERNEEREGKNMGGGEKEKGKKRTRCLRRSRKYSARNRYVDGQQQWKRREKSLSKQHQNGTGGTRTRIQKSRAAAMWTEASMTRFCSRRRFRLSLAPSWRERVDCMQREEDTATVFGEKVAAMVFRKAFFRRNTKNVPNSIYLKILCYTKQR
jgi:hypothetical protein